jgi:hypothetical protein
MEAAHYSETSVSFHHNTRRRVPKTAVFIVTICENVKPQLTSACRTLITDWTDAHYKTQSVVMSVLMSHTIRWSNGAGNQPAHCCVCDVKQS